MASVPNPKRGGPVVSARDISSRESRGVSIREDYASKWGFHDPEEYFHKGAKGIDHEVVEMMSRMKGEPDWMRDFRL